MIKSILLVLLFCLLMPLSVAAQDTEGPEQMPQDLCTAEGNSYLTNRLQDAIELLATGEDPQAVLIALQIALASYRADCANLIFTDEEYGLDVVTDPISFPSGVYRVIFESEDFGSMRLEQLDGDCGFVTAILTEAGQDQLSAQLAGCVALLEVNARAPWTLTFEPIAVAGN